MTKNKVGKGEGVISPKLINNAYIYWACMSSINFFFTRKVKNLKKSKYFDAYMITNIMTKNKVGKGEGVISK